MPSVAISAVGRSRSCSTRFVAGVLNHWLQALELRGKPHLAFGQNGERNVVCSAPEGIVPSAEDLLEISDRGNNRIRVFQIGRAQVSRCGWKHTTSCRVGV
jgi:hypothetical protein